VVCWSLEGVLCNGVVVARTAEFVPGLLGALAAVDVLLVGFEDNVILEGVVVKVVLLLARFQVPADLIMGIDGFVVAVGDVLLLFLFLRVLDIGLKGVLENSLLLDHSPPAGFDIVIFFVCKVAAMLRDRFRPDLRESFMQLLLLLLQTMLQNLAGEESPEDFLYLDGSIYFLLVLSADADAQLMIGINQISLIDADGQLA
jgi:hypothetical protein